MNRCHSRRWGRLATILATVLLGVFVAGCGGSAGNPTDSGTNKTYLSVEASDPDGDTLQYQWRVTAGSIENRNSSQTVWTMPDGPGLHFAYVTISDGKGGYVEQQYAVSSDALGTSAPSRAPVVRTASFTGSDGGAGRLTIRITDPNYIFIGVNGVPSAVRYVYLPDVRIEIHKGTATVNGVVVDPATIFAGTTDLGGEVDLPQLPQLQAGESYRVYCATALGAQPVDCGGITPSATAALDSFLTPTVSASQNLRVYGHIGFADGGVCGVQDEFFDIQSSATVQLLQDDGTALTPAVRVNRYGDYALDAAVLVNANPKLRVQCESFTDTIDVRASTDQASFVSTAPRERSYTIPNSRPTLRKMVANGPDGNVRGQMIVTEPGVSSNGLPGEFQFLTRLGKDTRLSACMYYRSFGAAGGCDAQGNLIDPISFDDWKRQHKLEPYSGTNQETAATYVNKMDLNLVRRMVATQSSADDIAFYVCNSPGPEGISQAEVDNVIAVGLADQKRVACVAMEWSVTPGANGGKAFTKFLTFAPDGSLLPSINLDGRGQKYMPGACVACHGGAQYRGRFPETGTPSPYLASGFLPFDTGNYLFSGDAALTESAQGASFYGLNQLVRATEPVSASKTATQSLIDGWYSSASTALDKSYVPDAWGVGFVPTGVPQVDAIAADKRANFYRAVIGASCRTCHVSLGPNFDWDKTVLTPARASPHVCGGTKDVAINASMPNALISRDHLLENVHADAELTSLMTTFLGCVDPSPDPVYPKR